MQMIYPVLLKTFQIVFHPIENIMGKGENDSCHTLRILSTSTFFIACAPNLSDADLTIYQKILLLKVDCI